MSTVDPLQAALGGDPPANGNGSGGGTPPAQADGPQIDHPVLSRYGGDVRKALDAYEELQRAYGTDGHRLGQQVKELEAQITQLQAAQQQPDSAQQPEGFQNGLPEMSVDQLQEWYDENPAQATAFLIAQGQEMLMAQIEQKLDQRLSPVENSVSRQNSSTVVEGLKKSLGDDVVARNVDTLAAMMKTDPGMFKGDPQLVFQRMKQAVIAADVEAGRNPLQRGTSTTADTAVLGGSGGRTPGQGGTADPGEQEIQEFVAALTGAGPAMTIFGTPAKRS